MVVAAFVLTMTVPPAVAAAAPKSFVITAPAGAVARVTLRSFLPLSDAQGSIDVLGASSGDVAGAALSGPSSWGVHVSTLKSGCRFAGKCTDMPLPHSWGTQMNGDVRGLNAGTYDFVVVGRPGAKVSLRLRNALAGQVLRFSPRSRHQVTELEQMYPSAPDQMPEAYFDEQLTSPAGKHVTVLIAHLQAGRPKTVQFSSCLRTGAAPAVHVPRYGSGCLGDDDNEFGGKTGAVSVGGEDCSATPSPACIPLTTDAFHVSFAHAQVFDAPAHVSLTADILAAQSNVTATAVTFTLP